MRKFFALVILILVSSCAYAFTPEDEIIPVSSIKSGMKGYVLTVLDSPERL